MIVGYDLANYPHNWQRSWFILLRKIRSFKTWRYPALRQGRQVCPQVHLPCTQTRQYVTRVCRWLASCS